MPHNWINKLNESNSRLHKEDVISQALNAAKIGANDAKIFLACAYQAYNPFLTFNFKRVPVLIGQTGRENPYGEFFQLLARLNGRAVTGNDAEVEVEQVAYLFDTDVWETLLRPTILKDLRVGATIKTFNKILKGTEYEIPVFECQLATDSTKHPKKLIGKKLLEPKLDGIRVLAISTPHSTKFFSRSGKTLDNFDHIAQKIHDVRKYFVSNRHWQEGNMQEFVLDGEIVSENFQALMKQAQRKTEVDTSDSVFTIFDVIRLSDFKKGHWNTTQRIRSLKYLESVKDKINEVSPSLHIITGIKVNLDTEEGHSIMQRYAEDNVAMGYEGIMVKDVDAPYQCKRGTAWMKWKPNITVDLQITDMEEGTGRNVGRLGALVCQGEDQGRDIFTNVGSGLSDEQRDEFWANKDSLIGSIVEIKADVVTQNQNGTYSLRFPRFLRFRDLGDGVKL